MLDLAGDCTYLLTADLDGSGLPAITTPINLNGGKNTAIERAAAAHQLRIVTVNAGGDLTLNHLTITGGHTNGAGEGDPRQRRRNPRHQRQHRHPQSHRRQRQRYPQRGNDHRHPLPRQP